MMNEFELAMFNLVKIFVFYKIFTFFFKVLFFKRKKIATKNQKYQKNESIMSKIFVIISNPIKFKLDDYIRNQEKNRKEILSQDGDYKNNIIELNSKKKKA